MGKGWSKGLTKATDPRVGRNAAAHVGRTYQRHPSYEEDRRHRSLAGPVDTTWTPVLAYAVGLIATDGNLSPNGKAVTVVSGEVDMLETFKVCIPRAGRIGRHGPNAWHVSVSSVTFYRWLESIGLSPRKSLTLGAIDVPEEFTVDLVRGLMDGDGSIRNYVHHPAGNVRRYPNYRYERLNVAFHSASLGRLAWLREILQRDFGISGFISTTRRDRYPNPMHELRYGKHASIALLDRMYADPTSPRLDRKWRIWEACLARPRINSLQKRRSGEMAYTRWIQDPLGRKAREGSSPSSGTRYVPGDPSPGSSIVTVVPLSSPSLRSSTDPP